MNTIDDLVVVECPKCRDKMWMSSTSILVNGLSVNQIQELHNYYARMTGKDIRWTKESPAPPAREEK